MLATCRNACLPPAGPCLGPGPSKAVANGSLVLAKHGSGLTRGRRTLPLQRHRLQEASRAPSRPAAQHRYLWSTEQLHAALRRVPAPAAVLHGPSGCRSAGGWCARTPLCTFLGRRDGPVMCVSVPDCQCAPTGKPDERRRAFEQTGSECEMAPAGKIPRYWAAETVTVSRGLIYAMNT